jgi:hypothetical protein
MNIKKSLLALAVMAMATMAFASSATAGTGKVVHVTTGTPIPENRVLHFVGWAQFTSGGGSYKCHVTSASKATGATGTTGQVTQFTVPDTTKCTGTGFLNGCKLKSHTTTNLPYHLTATEADIDVTGNIVLHNEYESCFVSKVTLTFSSITLTPAKTGKPSAETATGTAGRVAGIAKVGEAIAGAEIHGVGVAHVTTVFGTSEEATTAEGHLELSSATDRCTWKLVKA